MIEQKKALRQRMRKASAMGNNEKAATLAKRFDRAGGNSAAASKRITKGLQAKDARGQLRSAIKSGDKRAVRGATKAVRSTNTNAKRMGSSLRIKQKMGYK